ncbi:hypothetical protein D3C81_1882060 [compost metagenome]
MAGNGRVEFITASFGFSHPVVAINQRASQLHHIASQHGSVLCFPLIQPRGSFTFVIAFAGFERGADVQKHYRQLLTIQPAQGQTVLGAQARQYLDKLLKVRWKFLVQCLAPWVLMVLAV